MKKISEALKWIESETTNTSFGVVELSIIIHGGKIMRIEKSVTKKELYEGNEK